ncbi:Peroxisomal bifunctional enzyme [Nymphon striatum]|nr:Peroxisomal bifunctional enzyme [Nymphon striatum]
MGYGSVFTLLAEFRKRFGFSETELGIITAVGFFAGFVAQIGLARYADRGYTKHLIWAGIASATFGMLALTVADQYWQFVAARTLLGLGSGAVAPALRRLIISRDPEHLGENLGKLTAMEITGFVLGLPLQRYWPRSSIFAPRSSRWPSSTPCWPSRLLGLDLSTPGSTEERLPVRSLLKMKGIQIGLLLGVAIYITIGIFEAVWAVLLDDLGAETWLVGCQFVGVHHSDDRPGPARGAPCARTWSALHNQVDHRRRHGGHVDLWLDQQSVDRVGRIAVSCGGRRLLVPGCSGTDRCGSRLPSSLRRRRGYSAHRARSPVDWWLALAAGPYDEWGPRPLFTAGVAIMAIMVLLRLPGRPAMNQITESVSLEREGDVALVVVNNPPVNALSSHVRQGIFDAMTQAQESDATAIVLICEGRTFIAGADITEFGAGMGSGASLSDAQQAMENNTKPVVAAIHGTALGGGLEVGAVWSPAASPIGSAEALECGLINEIVDDLRSGAIAFANRAVAEQMPLLRIRDRDDKLAGADQKMFDDFRASIARKTRGFMAPEHNIKCIEAAVNLPFDEGMKREGELFGEVLSSVQSSAQQYYFFAERQALKIPDVPRDTPGTGHQQGWHPGRRHHGRRYRHELRQCRHARGHRRTRPGCPRPWPGRCAQELRTFGLPRAVRHR